MVRAWIYNEEDTGDQRLAHFTVPPQWITVPELESLGVSYWHIPTTVEAAIENPNGGKLGEIRRTRGYQNHDVIEVTPDKLPNYQQKIQMFFNEHLHEDEEIRYCLAGSGYFDVRRDRDQLWIRIEVTSGDMIVLPAGCYHRYTNDSNNFIHVMRLFKDNPKWEAINRGEVADKTSVRQQYKQLITEQTAKLPPAAVESVTGRNGESFRLPGNAAALANYPHMRAYGGLLYVSGISCRRLDNSYRGVSLQADGTTILDIEAQTSAVLENISSILSAVGADLSHVIDVTTFLVDMQHYGGYNKVYNQYFPSALSAPSRTTVAVHQLPNPNLLIEIKCVAVDPRTGGTKQ